MSSIRDLVGGYFSNVLQSSNRGEGTSRLAMERSSERYEQDQLVSLDHQSHNTTRKGSSLLRSRPLFEFNKEKRGSISSMESTSSSSEQSIDSDDRESCYYSVVGTGNLYRSVQIINHQHQQQQQVDYSANHIARIQRDRLIAAQGDEQHHHHTGRRFAAPGDRRQKNRPKREQLLEIFMGAAALNL